MINFLPIFFFLFQVAALTSLNLLLPFMIMGGSSLLGGLLILIGLPETLGKPLPETMEEALDLSRKKKNISTDVSSEST